MYNPDLKQIILKNSLGVSYHVYFESGKGLCLRMLGESRVWSRGFVLSDLSVNDFSAILDNEDIIHFAFQAKDGRIFYGHGRHGKMDIQPVLNSRDTTPWTKHISLLVCKKSILLFYVIRHKDQQLLSMQTIQKGILSKPIVIDYVVGTNKNYLVFFDHSEKCHLFYIGSFQSENVFIHRILKDDHSLFNAPDKQFITSNEILFPSAVCDHNNQIHLLFQIHGNNTYEILYKKPGIFEPEKSLFISPSPPGYSGLVYRNSELIFFRISSQKIFYRKSDNGGKNWSDEAPYAFGNGGVPKCFLFYSKYQEDQLSSLFTEAPGNFSKGYRIAFFDEEPDLPNQKVGHVLEGRISEPDHILPAKKPKETRQTDSTPIAKDWQKKIILLQNLTDNMQKDLTKLWITQKDFEKKLEQLSQKYLNLNRDMLYLRKKASDTVTQKPNEPEATDNLTSDINSDNCLTENTPPE